MTDQGQGDAQHTTSLVQGVGGGVEGAPGAGSVVRRTSWGMADQLLSSLSNFAVAVVIARSVDRVGFGAFSLAFATYTVVLGTVRAVSAEPLAVRHRPDPAAGPGDATASAVGAALAVGLAAAAAVAVLGVALGGRLGPALVPLALVLPGLVVQDAWRSAFLATGRPARAFANDLVWVVTEFALFALLLALGEPTVGSLIGAWGGGAAVAAVAGGIQAGAVPRVGVWRAWLAGHRDLWPRFTLEFWAMTGTWQLGLYSLAAVAGIAAAGAVRGAQTALGPAALVLLAAPLVAVPELVRLRGRPDGVRAILSASRRLALGLAALPLAVGAALLVVPTSVGTEVLGDTWGPARALIPALAVFVASTGVNVAVIAGLRALAAARASLRTRLLASPLVLSGVVVGALVADAQGAAVGLAVTNWLTTGLWWRALRSAAAGTGPGAA